MDDEKVYNKKGEEICGEVKLKGSSLFVCGRGPHTHRVIKQKRCVQEGGILYFPEPPAESHRFVSSADI